MEEEKVHVQSNEQWRQTKRAMNLYREHCVPNED
jgi:hypothetical protein